MTLRLECFLKILSEDHLSLRVGVSDCFPNSGDLSSDVPMYSKMTPMSHNVFKIRAQVVVGRYDRMTP